MTSNQALEAQVGETETEVGETETETPRIVSRLDPEIIVDIGAWWSSERNRGKMTSGLKLNPDQKLCY